MKKWLIGLMIGLICLSGCRGSTPRSRSAVALDTAITITLYDEDADEALLDDCIRKVKEYEELFSRTVDGSDIDRINKAGGEWVAVSPETKAMVEEALSVCQKTDGALDITVGRVTELWDFKAADPTLPSADDLIKAVASVDYTQVEIQGERLRLTDPQAALDMGGIAKGYIADRLGDYLLEQGVDGAVIDLGGNILTVGQKEGKPFAIGVQDPHNEGELIATLSVADRAVVTSGSYERGFTKGGVRYHHILDPKTGYPVQNGLASVTILCEEAVTGDMLSTACFVLGEEKGMALIEQTEGVEALFVRDDGTTVSTNGFYK